MSWQTDLLDASFRGVAFEVESVDDNGEKSLALHEYPYRAGANIEDLGRKARIIPVRALIWGDDYAERLQKLIAAFESSGPGELIHPVYGVVNVVIRKWEVHEEAERPDYAALSFEAVEADPDKPFFEAVAPKAEAESRKQSALQGVAAALESTAQAIRDKFAAVEKAGQAAMDAAQEVIDDALAVYDAAAGVADAAADMIRYPQTFLDELQNRMEDALRHAGKRMGSFAQFGDVSAMLPRWTLDPGEVLGKYTTGSGAHSTRWITGRVPRTAKEGAPLAVRADSPASTPVAAHAPCSAQTVRGVVAAHAMTMQTQAITEAACGIFEAELAEPGMTPDQIETITGNVRERVQDCLDAVRAALPAAGQYAPSEGLRQTADAVQGMAAAVLNARPPLSGVVADAPCNMHLMAHRLYGDFTRAAELQRLNPQIRNPNFIARGQELVAYAE